MKRFLRRFLRRFLTWLADDQMESGVLVSEDDGRMVAYFRCGLGVTYAFDREPDDIRQRGWNMIEAADEAERIQEGLPAL